MVEMGRFCLDPDYHDPDILRLEHLRRNTLL